MKRFEHFDYINKKRHLARSWAIAFPFIILTQGILVGVTTGLRDTSFQDWVNANVGIIFDLLVVNFCLFVFLVSGRLIGLYGLGIFMCWYAYLCALSGVKYIEDGAILVFGKLFISCISNECK